MENLVVPLTFVVLGLSQVSMMIYYWYFGKQIKQIGQINNSSDQSDQMGWRSLHGAIKKSEAIVAEAEIESIKNLAQSSQQIGKMEKKYSDEMETTAADVQRELMAQSAKATERFKAQLEDESKQIKKLNETVDNTIKENVEQMLARFGTDLSTKLADVETKSLAAADLEVAAMKKTVEEYRKRRIEQIDSEAVEIVNKVMTLLVQKEFSTQEHLEAIKNAFEEAKEEHFIG